jgi:hypothetical protein
MGITQVTEILADRGVTYVGPLLGARDYRRSGL